MNKTDRRVAPLTGASTGIGRATAKELQKVGYRVFGTSRRIATEGPDGVTMIAWDGYAVEEIVTPELFTSAVLDLHIYANSA